MLTVVLMVLTGCECDESLNKICPAPVSCWVEQTALNDQDNIMISHFPDIATRGVCDLGQTACDEEGNLFCDGIVYRTEEICDFKDNNCNGEIDEGYDVDEDGYTECNGDCDDNDPNRFPNNFELCDGIDNNCDNYIPPDEIIDSDGDGSIRCLDCDDNNNVVAPGLVEVCDLLDNDCNGEVDDDTVETYQTCGPMTDLGVCTQGTGTCIGGEIFCPAATFPSAEGCDGLDNDCDGQIDEELLRECYSECGWGYEFCGGDGKWVGCTAASPTPEICGDSIDNNCDGQVDEGCLCIPTTLSLCAQDVIDEEGNSLNCGTGFQECDETGHWGDCVWFTNQPEACNNYDDDCDGTIDGMIEICGDSEFAGIGECKLGESTCAEGEWSECEGSVEPIEEICNELDDNCNGEVDENLNSHDKVDMVFMFDGSGSMCGYKDSIIEGLGQYISDFENSEHRFALVIFPIVVSPFGSTPWGVIIDLVDVNQFIATLGAIDCNYPGSEPNYDVTYALADNTNPAGISWRNDAYPYLIMMTDENPQSWAGYTESEVATNVADCQVGNCESGDPYEIFVFTHTAFFTGWDEITFFEPERLISINPPIAGEYVNKLRGVFRDVCFNGSE